MYSGYGWSHQAIEYDWGYASLPNNGNCSIVFAFPPDAGKDIYVKNNIFYLSKYALVGGKHGGNGLKARYEISFSGNTYVQNPFGILIQYPPLDDNKYAREYLCNINSRKYITDLLGDKSGMVFGP